MAAATPAAAAVAVADLPGALELEATIKRDRLQGTRASPPPLHPAARPQHPPPPGLTTLPLPLPAVVELYSEWAGPTAACKSTWRKQALEHGGALPFDLSTACIEHCRGAAALAQHPAAAASSSEPQFLLFKAGKEVAHIAGVNLPELLKAVAKYSSEGPGGRAVQRLESEA